MFCFRPLFSKVLHVLLVARFCLETNQVSLPPFPRYLWELLATFPVVVGWLQRKIIACKLTNRLLVPEQTFWPVARPGQRHYQPDCHTRPSTQCMKAVASIGCWGHWTAVDQVTSSYPVLSSLATAQCTLSLPVPARRLFGCIAWVAHTIFEKRISHAWSTKRSLFVKPFHGWV